MLSSDHSTGMTLLEKSHGEVLRAVEMFYVLLLCREERPGTGWSDCTQEAE